MCVQEHMESEQNSSPATPYTSREWRCQRLALQAPANPEEQVWSPGRGTPWNSLPGSSVHGILLARILEWVAMPFSRGSSQLRD